MKPTTAIHLPPNFRQRLILLCVSIFFMGFGVSWLLTIGFGTDSFATVNQGIVRHVPISFGTSELIFNGTLLLLVLIIDRRQIGIGTVLNMVCIGYIADFFNWVWTKLFPAGFFDSLAVRYALMLPGLAVFVLSCACYMAAELGVSAYDAVPVWLDKKIPKLSGRFIRICWDLFFIAAGWLMGADIGIVTVLMAFVLGPVIAAVKNRFQGLLSA